MELISKEEVVQITKKYDTTIYDAAMWCRKEIKELKTYTPCFLGSPCEYQNPEVKLPETANADAIADLKIIAEALVAIIDKECCDYGYHIAYDKAEKWLGESEDGTD